MEKRYQVFISSTFTDLQPARKEISDALLKANCFPAGMELFPAADEEQFEYIKTVIDASDYYLIVSAGRYGTVHPESGISYTEMEYDYAVEVGKPIIRLLHKDPLRQLPGEYIETSEEGRGKLEDFRRKITQKHLVNFWSDYKELGQLVVLGLLDVQKRKPTTGWVRDKSVGAVEANNLNNDDFILAVQAAVRAYLGEAGQKPEQDTGGNSDNVDVFAVLGQLASSVSNDFNNLLTGIAGHCDLLLLRHDEGTDDYEHLVQIHRYTNRAAAIASQLLAYSRKQNLRPISLDLGEAIHDMNHLLKRLVGRRIDISIVTNKRLPNVSFDKRQFEQVMMNLVVNARDAMPNGGEIEISTNLMRVRKDKKVISGILTRGDYILIEVEDNGAGISQDEIKKIFQPYYSTKAVDEGYGLGLSTVLGIVTQSGGSLNVVSTQGSGTVFQVLVPIVN